MNRSLRCLISLILLLVAFETPTSAQVNTGTPPFNSFEGGPDTVNLANLNVNWNIPVFQKAGRGLPFSLALNFNTYVWYKFQSGTQTVWAGTTSLGEPTSSTPFGSVTRTAIGSDKCGGRYPLVTYSNWTYIDAGGTPHPFGIITQSSSICATTSETQTSTDGSGYTMSVTGGGANSVTTPDGTVINFVASTVQDRNGNQISLSGASGVYTDTLGTTALTVPPITMPNPATYTYTAPSGASATVTMKQGTYTLQTKFGCSGVSDAGPTSSWNLVSEIDLPDIAVNPNDKYTFAYEQTPTVPGNVTGRLASVTLPTGGMISYSYSGPFNGINCADGSAETLTRTTPDGTWIYTRVLGTAAASTTTVTDPQGNQTVIQFQNGHETQRTVYQGSTTSGTLLRTINTCYNGAASPCINTAVVTPIATVTVLDQLGSTSGPVCEHVYSYNSYGLPTEQDDYDYGSGGPGALLKKNITVYAPPSNGIVSMLATTTICSPGGTDLACNSSGTVVAQTSYTYDGTATLTSSGVAQHVSVTGSRGNLTSVNYPVSGLTANFTYWDTGSPNTTQDVNGGTTTYNYSSNTASCQMAFPTGITEAISTLTQSYTWNCTGGVQLTAKDENSQVTSTAYTDAYFWRPSSENDQLNNATSFTYGTNPMSVQQSLLFNGNNSIAHTGLGYDGLGRLIFTEHAQTPSPTAWDAVQQSYDSNGRTWKTSTPCVTTGSWTCPTTGRTITYDALNRISQVTDAGGGTTTYTYPQNDVLITVGPAPSGENTKRHQLEYNSIGQLTSVCEFTTLTGSGTCGQNSPQTGYWTKYAYDALGDLLTVTQNAQVAAANQQSRAYVYDAMGRLTSETNPESGTTTYAYDSLSITGCTSTSKGDLIKRADANGNFTCNYYDSLHRLTDVGNTIQGTQNACKRFRYDNTAGYAGSTKPSGISNTLGRLAEAATDACAATDPIVTDEWFSYTVRGEVSDVYELTQHSSPTYYHVTQTYWPNGGPNVLAATNNMGLPTITYGAEGEGRPSTVSASTGQNPVSAANYYNMYKSPYQLSVTFGSGDSDTFTYDANTLRLNKYQFKVGSQTVTGTLGWNANWSLGSLGITDPFSSANTQTCAFAADDLSRISQVGCGTIWGQSFSYDPFGNIQKTATPGTGGSSFLPAYQSSPSITNRISSVGGSSASYDSNGNSLNDTFRAYTWNAYNDPITVGSVSLVYDAFDRMVDQSVSGSNSEIVYSPTGVKLALMNGTTLTKAFVTLPGGATAVYTSASIPTIAYYRHTDHLGSSRLASTPNQTLYADLAYSPFGETYASSGAIDPSFTGQNQDTTSGLYDFLFREYDSLQARWTSPDPSGLAAVDPTDPQSWNRYSYVRNRPLRYVDLHGLTCYLKDEDGNITDTSDPDIDDQDDCSDDGDYGGSWLSQNTVVVVNSDQSDDDTNICSYSYAGGALLGSQCGDQFNPAEPPLTNQDYIKAIAKALPTVCGGGVFFYAGLQGKSKKIGTGGFAGYLGEWDSNTGYSNNGLIEAAGDYSAVGGALNKSGVDTFVFIPAGPVGEFGGGVIGPQGAGVYVGTPEKFPVGLGGGGYLNITTAEGCKAAQSKTP